VPFIDLKLDVNKNTGTQQVYLEVDFAQDPDFHLEFDAAMSQLLKHQICNSVIQASNVQNDPTDTPSIQFFDSLANYLADYSEDPFEDSEFIMPIDDAEPVKQRQIDFKRSCLRRKPRFSTKAQDTLMKQFLMFGCPGRHKLAQFNKYNIGVRTFHHTAQLDDQRYLVGHHPLRSVPHRSPSLKSYPRYVCVTADFERYWPEPDIEGYRTSVLFVDIDSRFAYTVRLSSYSQFLEAFQEYESFIWTMHGLEIKYFYGDSDTQWQATEEIKMAKTRAYQYMVNRGTRVETSPPNTHQLNTIVEDISGQCLHIMNRFLMIGCMSQKLRGRAWIYAVFIFTTTPGPNGLERFANGETPFFLFYGYRFDTSIIPGPLFCSIMITSIGHKSGQAVRCSRQGIFIGLSMNSVCIIGLELETKKTVRVYH